MAKKKILVIEDDEGAADLIRTILDKEGYEVAYAVDGKIGVEKAIKFQPDLAIVDIMLPRMHGYAVCEFIRSHEETKAAKILVVSSKAYAQDMDAARDSGADDYLTKPYSIDVLTKKVKTLLGIDGGGATPASESHPKSPA